MVSHLSKKEVHYVLFQLILHHPHHLVVVQELQQLWVLVLLLVLVLLQLQEVVIWHQVWQLYFNNAKRLCKVMTSLMKMMMNGNKLDCILSNNNHTTTTAMACLFLA